MKLHKLILAALVFALLCFAMSGCAAAGAASNTTQSAKRTLQDYAAARQDGKVTAAELATLDADMFDLGRSADELESAMAKSLPPLDNPTSPIEWANWLLGIAGVGGTGYAAYRKTVSTAKREVNAERDTARRKRGEPIEPVPVANNPLLNPTTTIGPHA